MHKVSIWRKCVSFLVSNNWEVLWNEASTLAVFTCSSLRINCLRAGRSPRKIHAACCLKFSAASLQNFLSSAMNAMKGTVSCYSLFQGYPTTSTTFVHVFERWIRQKMVVNLFFSVFLDKQISVVVSVLRERFLQRPFYWILLWSALTRVNADAASLPS